MPAKINSCTLAVAALVLSQTACGIRGAGATRPALLYDDWIEQIGQHFPDAKIHYEEIGSQEGLRLLFERRVDFAGTDIRLTQQQKDHLSRDVIEVPTTIGAIAPIYNLPGVSNTLHFSRKTLSKIFSGKATSWNDPDIQLENQGVDLPPRDIVVVHRSDGSGTTCLFGEFLRSADAVSWQSLPAPKAEPWNLGCDYTWAPKSKTASGSEGVTKFVQDTRDAIGYVEYSFAAESETTGTDGFDWGYVQNDAGNFRRARIATVQAAADSLSGVPRDSLIQSTNSNAYPISALSWMVIPIPTRETARKGLCEFLSWMLDDGQRRAPGIGYLELPKSIVDQERPVVNRVCR